MLFTQRVFLFRVINTLNDNYFPKQLQMAGFLTSFTPYTTRLCFEIMLLFTTKHKTHIPPPFVQATNSLESVSFMLGYNITGSWGQNLRIFDSHALPQSLPPPTLITTLTFPMTKFSSTRLQLLYTCLSTLSKASHGGVRSSCPGDQRQNLHAQTKRAAGHRVMWD